MRKAKLVSAPQAGGGLLTLLPRYPSSLRKWRQHLAASGDYAG
jgi:hypothetical protein